jgi:hypothetical protein
VTAITDRLRAKSQTEPQTAAQIRLRVVHLGVWTTTKLAFLIGVIVGIITIVVVFLLWQTLHGSGIFDQIDALLASDQIGSGKTHVASILTLGRAMQVAVVLAVVDVVVISVVGAVAAICYNLATKLVGGLFFGFSPR